MPTPHTYSLSLRPQYVPNPERPEYMFGQVLFQDGVTQRVACTVEFRADWAINGEVETSQPDPPVLPELDETEIKNRATKFVTLFRDDKIRGSQSTEDNDDEMETLQASDLGVASERGAAK